MSVVFALLLVAARAEAQFTPGPAAVAAEDYHVELGLMLWQPTPELTLTTGDSRVGTVDFVEEFGITDERFRDVRATLKLARKHKLRFGYVQIKYDQDAVLQRNITFQNITFPVTADANADIKWDVYQFGYEWDLLSMSHGYLGIVGQVKYNKVSANVTAGGLVNGQTVSLSAATEQTAPVPTIGAAARGYLGEYVSIGGEFTAFKYENDDFRGKFYDFDIYGAVHLGRHLGGQAGYRSMDVDFLVDGEAGTMKNTGPYFGGFVRF